MTFQCEIVAQHVLPTLRALIARKLVKEHHLSQTTAARKLGTTQAAISQYLSSKRRGKFTEQLETDPSIQTLVEELAEKIATTETNVPLSICEHCKTLKEKAATLNQT
jgi:predicted transcriptional regulator